MSNHLSQLKDAIKKLSAYRLNTDLYRDQHDKAACSCKDKCYQAIEMYGAPTEKYNHCFIHCMRNHGVVTYDNAIIPQKCNQ